MSSRSSSFQTKKIVVMAMLAAIAYAVMLLAHLVPFFQFIPSLPFLKYDPKDVIIAIAAFMLGPLEALAITVVVSLIEMVTISSTGIIGLIMNVLSTAAFACSAGLIYKKQHNMKGAVLGLICGVILMTAVMLLWNYLITPLYMKVSREMIASLLFVGFLPFNLIKAAANMALTLLIYKPVVTALRRAHLLPPPSGSGSVRHSNTGLILFAVVLLITCILVALVFLKVI